MSRSSDQKINDVLTEDLWLRVKRAKNARDEGKYDRAQRLIDDVLERLQEAWDVYGPDIDSAGAEATSDQKELVFALAEVHGVRGGILRSREEYDQAVDAYDQGYSFEKHEARKADNSYNLLQRLVNRILLEPKLLGAASWNVKGEDLHEALKAAESVIDQQINGKDKIGGPRKRDPWAACDLVFLLMLQRDQPNQDFRSRLDEAWEILERTRPKKYVYESNLRVIKDLLDDLGKLPDDSRNEAVKRIESRAQDLKSRFEKGYASGD